MEKPLSQIVIVGGGTAGWLAACAIAARAQPVAPPISVTLVESPDVPTIGVGEGTWPSIRATLKRIGIAEADFLQSCDGSFKQGTRFDGWSTGGAQDRYYHPFTRPDEIAPRDLVAAWEREASRLPFAHVVSPQPHICAAGLAPRQLAMADYVGVLNYAYHLDAGKFAELLLRNAVGRLGVRHVRDHVVAVERAEDGDIKALRTRSSGLIEGELFLDCTGHAGLLIGKELAVEWIDRSHVLFNDRALATQVPVAAGSPIAAQTNATAHRAGWIWDIGLPNRRGVGCVYASEYCDDEAAAEILRAYLRRTAQGADGSEAVSFRRLTFDAGHRARFWERNCVAIGLSAGFVEPLEASAIVMIEFSLLQLLDHWPATRSAMPSHARRFNELFQFRWERIVEFLKLHYVLSRRDEPYWRAHRDSASIPPRLAELLEIWRYQPPSLADLPTANEMFPSPSYQYVLYGMNFAAPPASPFHASRQGSPGVIDEVEKRVRQLAPHLPTNRAYLDALCARKTEMARP